MLGANNFFETCTPQSAGNPLPVVPHMVTVAAWVLRKYMPAPLVSLRLALSRGDPSWEQGNTPSERHSSPSVSSLRATDRARKPRIHTSVQVIIGLHKLRVS